MIGGAYSRRRDRGDNKTPISEFRCSSEPMTMVLYSVLCAYIMCLLVVVLKFGNESQAAGELFKETKCIYVGSNVGSIVFIAFGVFILFTKSYDLQIAIRGYGIYYFFVSFLSPFFFSFLIMVFFVYRKNQSEIFSIFFFFRVLLGTLLTEALWLYLLFYPKIESVYFPLLPGEDGMTDGERDLAKQYQITFSEQNGKELLLILNAIISEIHHRVKRMQNCLSIFFIFFFFYDFFSFCKDKIIKIELNEVLLNEARELLGDLTELLEDPQSKALQKVKTLSLSAIPMSSLNSKEVE